MLHGVIGTSDQNRSADIIFVHGLNPLGTHNPKHAFLTWGGEDKSSSFWPFWLGRDLSKEGMPVGIWILEYDAAAFGWLGHAMPLNQRAANLLDNFFGEKIGNSRPVIFIAHSLGGLVVKELLMYATLFNRPTERALADQTKAVVFLSTPHTGAGIASFLNSLGVALRQTEALRDLAANNSHLLEQAQWYLEWAPKNGVQTRTYFETKRTNGTLVVGGATANPFVAGAPAIPLDEDHSSIARVASDSSQQYKSILRFIQESLTANPTPARQ